MKYTKNLIDVIKKYNHKKKYGPKKQQKVFYFCCMVGGYESYDKLVHLLVNTLRHSIKVNLCLYYPFKVDIDKRIEETELMYNDKDKEEIDLYLKNIKNNNKQSVWDNKIDIKWVEFLNISMTLRGLYERVNYNKIYVGNFSDYGKVLNYYINDVDINIINKLREIYGDNKMESLFRAYFQMPQLMHPTKFFWYDHQALLLKENICVDYKKKKINYNINCKERDDSYISNLTTILMNYGDCRESSLILGVYKHIIEWQLFIDLLNKKKFNEIENLIINQRRLISTDIYLNSNLVYIDYVNYPKYYFNLKVLNKNSKIDKQTKIKMINNKIFYQAENHEFNIMMELKNGNYILKCNDLMYSHDMFRYDMNDKYDRLYSGDYLIDGIKIKYDVEYYNLGKNVFNKKIFQYGVPIIPMFKRNIYYFKDYNLKGKYIFISKNIELSKNFYDIDKYIVEREMNAYNNRIKYFFINNKISRYIQYKEARQTAYFLLEDIINHH